MPRGSEIPAFVGRTRELAAIADMTAWAASESAPAGVLVLGSTGQGKSRLLEEAGTRIKVDHGLALVGYEPERNVPLAAATGLLRTLSGQRDWLPALFSGEFPGGGTALDPIRIFEAAHLAVGRLGRVLLTIDDVQWVDDLSLALCHYLVRAASTSGDPLALLAAARPSAVASRFASSLGQLLGQQHQFAILELGPLTVEDAISLVAELDPETGPERATELWSQAGGSPFWLETLVRASRAGLDPVEIVGERLRSLTPDASSVLADLTVAAKPFSIGELARLEDWLEPRAEAAASELVSWGLAAGPPGGVALTHDLIRSAAARHLPASSRRAIHRRIAALLEAEAGDDVQALRAALEHRRAGRLPMLDLALRLAHSPRRRWLGSEGLRELTEIARDVDTDDAAEQGELQEAVASLASELSDHAIALQLWSALAEATADDGRRQRAMLACAREAYHLERRPDARSWVARCRAERGVSPATSLALDAIEARVAFWWGDTGLSEGRTAANRAVRAARRMAKEAGGPDRLGEARPAYVEALSAGRDAANQSYDLRAMTRIGEELIAGTRGYDEAMHLDAVVGHAVALRIAGRLREAEDRLRYSWEQARQRLLPSVAVAAGYLLARTLHDLGRLDDADEIAAEAASIAARTGDSGRNRVIGLLVVHELALSRDDWRQAASALRTTADGPLSAHERQYLFQCLAKWLARLGGLGAEKDVVALVMEGRRLAEIAGCSRCRLENELPAAEALLRVGQVPDARRALDQWDLERPAPTPQDAFRRRRLEALLAMRDGDSARALSMQAVVIDEADQAELGFDGLWMRLDLARFLVALDRGRAAEVFREAAERAERMGARTEARLADQGLRALGVRTWRRGPASSRGVAIERLSERELEIARLVAGGASNPEIAGQLFLSRKTVERHVSNVLAKLDARNRTELALILGSSATGP